MPPQFARIRGQDPDYSDYDEPSGQSLHGFHSHLHNDVEIRRSMAAYYGMMSLIDYEIGRILAYLDHPGTDRPPE